MSRPRSTPIPPPKSQSRPQHPAVMAAALCLFLVAGWACAGESAGAGAASGSTAQAGGPSGDGTVTAESLESSLRVVASRNNAYYGFNTPEIQLHLPLTEESNYAQVTMSPPKLVDVSGREVEYELERGLHDVEVQIVEIRFLAPDGETPAEFDRAVGEITMVYPLGLDTRTLAAGESDDSVKVTAESVAWLHDLLPEAAPFAEVKPLRVYDGAGNLLEKNGQSISIDDADNTWEEHTFEGGVARAEVDTIGRRAQVTIQYEVPIAPPIPEQERATPIEDPRAVEQDPKSRITIKVTVEEGEEAQASAPAAPSEPETRVAEAVPSPPPRPTPSKESVPIVPASELSETARQAARALEALSDAAPEPLAVVQVVLSTAFGQAALSVDDGGSVREWSWANGQVSGPSEVDTRWLQCTQGLPSGALTLERLPAILDDATNRVGGGSPIQLIVGQGPCGTASIMVPFEGGAWVQYEGDGRLVQVESPKG